MMSSVLLSGLVPLRDSNEEQCWYNRPFVSQWPESSQHQPTQKEKLPTTIGKIRKPKRRRTAFTTHQLTVLEQTFKRQKYIDKNARNEICKLLDVSDRCVKIWFQNRRMKVKRESSESSSESSLEDNTPRDFQNLNESPANQEVYQFPTISNNLSNNSVESHINPEVGSDFQNTSQELVHHSVNSSSYPAENNTPISIPEQTHDNSTMHNYFNYYNYNWQSNDYAAQYIYPNYYTPANGLYEMPLYANHEYISDTNIYPTYYYPNQPGNENVSGVSAVETAAIESTDFVQENPDSTSQCFSDWCYDDTNIGSV